MKKNKKLSVCLALLLGILLLGVLLFNLSNQKTVKADIQEAAYSFYFESYDVTYDVASNRKIKVTENINVHFTGFLSTGLIRDIPVNSGDVVKNVTVKELKSGEAQYVYYDVYMEDDFVCVDIGDHSIKTGQNRTYIITYDYYITKTPEGKNNLSLNAIGAARDCSIESASVQILLPKGFRHATCSLGSLFANTPLNFTTETINGRNCLSLQDLRLGSHEGVTFNMAFDDGSLSTYTDFKPYWGVAIGVILLAIVIALKFLCFNKGFITPVVNYEAPNKMDPLLMGKLIDNKVDGSDVTSLIFYWASKGYLQINLDDKNDPTIIRTIQVLPESCADYERAMFYNLFASSEMVKPSELKNKFYKTVDRVTSMVNAKTKGLYDKKSVIISFMFVVLATLLMGGIPFFSAFGISSKFQYFIGFVTFIPLGLFYALFQAVNYNRLKITKRKMALMYLGITLGWIAFTCIYVILVPYTILATLPKIIICAVTFPVIFFAASTVNKTPEYINQLNDIVGFKQFITLAEKPQLELMLEEDPQFYYHILPYAQVLGVSDKWENKFKNLTVEPPKWACGSFTENYLEFLVLNSLLRSSINQSITKNMTSRPSNSGSSGHGGFGGHVGGGHGGGGFRGR